MRFKCGALALLVSVSVQAVTNLERYDVNKAVDYTQNSPSAPTTHDRFQLEAFIQPVSASGTPALDSSGATLTHSGGTASAFSFDSSSKEYRLIQGFGTQALLDASFNNGVFDFAFSTLAPASYNPSVTLTGDNYPSLVTGGAVPFFTGLSASDFSGGSLQIDNSSAYTFNWNSFSGSFNPDEYVFQIEPTSGGGPVDFQIFQSATTSHTISSGTLTAGTSYIAQIWHRDVNVHDTTTLGAPTVGQSSYISRTSIQLTAVPEPSTYGAMFGVAAIGFAIWNRRRTRSTVEI